MAAAAIIGQQTSVSASAATKISAPRQANGIASIYIRNTDAANSVYLGGDNTVTATGGANPGYELKKGEILGPVTLGPGTSLYGLAATAAVVVDVLESHNQ